MGTAWFTEKINSDRLINRKDDMNEFKSSIAKADSRASGTLEINGLN